MKRIALLSLLLSIVGIPMNAYRLEPIRFGNFSQWVSREITESKVIGGHTKTVYEIAPNDHIVGNEPYTNAGGSPWATSNVYAKVSGVVKASNTVSPFVNGADTCARLEAKMENVKVLGLINMDVMVAGSIFLGRVFEPISSTKGPYSKMEMGVPYTKRPAALVYDSRWICLNLIPERNPPDSRRKRPSRGVTMQRCTCYCRNAGRIPTENCMPREWARRANVMTSRYLGQKVMP